jgi:FKBP-type peptidyl-prolyl cis-trans isomerase 2
MNSETYASAQWVMDRERIIQGIEKQLEKLLEGRTTGAFIVDVHGPYGSRNEDVKELPV